MPSSVGSRLGVLVRMFVQKAVQELGMSIGAAWRAPDLARGTAFAAADVAPSVTVVILHNIEASPFGMAENRGDGGLRVPPPAHHVATLQHCCIIATGTLRPVISEIPPISVVAEPDFVTWRRPASVRVGREQSRASVKAVPLKPG
jgi:hypothetical protein